MFPFEAKKFLLLLFLGCMFVYSILTTFHSIRTHERQLRLFDIRLRNTELHAFGWKQESSDSQSALINQAWSPDGHYITSGSADPVIHIFDIRYTAHKPSQSIRAHQKRVFRAMWLQSIPLVISISSDLNIGLHKVYSWTSCQWLRPSLLSTHVLVLSM